MATSKKDLVNLDGLIRREDLESKRPAAGRGGIPVTELALGRHYYGLLRKPQFQRETDDWSIDNVVTIIKSFRDGQLIPAVILWMAEGYTFVIDGAHRLSAFIAWVNDDYGDGQTSRAFFGGHILKRQKEIATECRRLVAQEGCNYAELMQLTNMAMRTPEQLSWSTNISKAIETQWVVGDADAAAASFLIINERAVQIDPTERYMIERRKAPNVIAARALVTGARGHPWWGDFPPGNTAPIEKKAKAVYNAIFEPEDAMPEATQDLQAGGGAHTANGLRISLDLVNLTNEVKGLAHIPEDNDGSTTARFLDKTYGVVKYIAGKDHASLGLHPAVYFWGATGNHRPSVFLAMVAYVQEMILRDELVKFTTHRARLEEFLIGKSGIGKYLLTKHGGWKKSIAPIKLMFRTVIDGLAAGKNESQIEADLLNIPQGASTAELEIQTIDAKAWRETKNTKRHQARLDSAPRCAICKARMVFSDASDDHIKRRATGGSDSVENAQMTHRYCNTGFKEYFEQRGLPMPEIASPA